MKNYKNRVTKLVTVLFATIAFCMTIGIQRAPAQPRQTAPPIQPQQRIKVPQPQPQIKVLPPRFHPALNIGDVSICNGVITIRIKNDGAGNAHATRTIVLLKFSRKGVMTTKTFAAITPGIVAGNYYDMDVKLPDDAEYGKSITVDVTLDAAHSLIQSSKMGNVLKDKAPFPCIQ